MATRSKTAPSTPRLSEYAQKFTYPAGITKTVWPRIEAKGLEIGLGFDWWQSQLGQVCVGYNDDGRYVATVGGIGLSIPRQVGKTYFVLALLVIMCILFPGLQVVWTAHHLRTSTKTFTHLRGICRRKKVAPHIKALRSANGEQQAEFSNGSMIMFGSRARGFGRGFDEVDVEVFDEAQILDTKSLEDMIAATNQARHEHGALLFFMGTPPRPGDVSEAFSQRRVEALAGHAKDAIWLEIGADPKSDPDDRSQWPLMNPSHPKRTPTESMERLRKNLGDEDSWNREGRGIWDPSVSNFIIDPQSWATVAEENSRAEDRFALAVDVSPDRRISSVAFAGQRADGAWHVELDEQRNGTGWLVQYLVERCERNPIRTVVIDGASPANSIVDDLKQAGINVSTTTAREMAGACGQFYDGVMDAWLHHIDQPQLNLALSVARKRSLGDAWAWNRKNAASDITPIVAATLALWGAQSSAVTQPRQPSIVHAF